MPNLNNEEQYRELIAGLGRVEQAVRSLVFPIPNPTTPAFKDSNGHAVSAVLNSGNIPVSASFSGAIADIEDGAGDSIMDATNDAMQVSIVNDAVGIGGGTQYTEDAAATANPVGNALILVREDARAGSLTTADGDNVAARGNNKGEMYVKTTDSDALLTTIDADTGNIATAAAAIQSAVEGTLTVGSHAVTNAGTFAVQVDAALPSGTNAIGKLAANSGVDIGDVDVTSLPTSTPFFDADGDNTAQALKASAGTLYGLHVVNSNAADAYIQLFDTAAGSVTVGTTTPVQSYLVPAASGSLAGAIDLDLELGFSTAITYACTTTPTGNTDPTTGLTVNARYA